MHTPQPLPCTGYAVYCLLQESQQEQQQQQQQQQQQPLPFLAPFLSGVFVLGLVTWGLVLDVRFVALQ
jgi:F0F1-type ATP synthase assembly protein I